MLSAGSLGKMASDNSVGGHFFVSGSLTTASLSVIRTEPLSTPAVANVEEYSE